MFYLPFLDPPQPSRRVFDLTSLVSGIVVFSPGASAEIGNCDRRSRTIRPNRTIFASLTGWNAEWSFSSVSISSAESWCSCPWRRWWYSSIARRQHSIIYLTPARLDWPSAERTKLSNSWNWLSSSRVRRDRKDSFDALRSGFDMRRKAENFCLRKCKKIDASDEVYKAMAYEFTIITASKAILRCDQSQLASAASLLCQTWCLMQVR